MQPIIVMKKPPTSSTVLIPAQWARVNAAANSAVGGIALRRFNRKTFWSLYIRKYGHGPIVLLTLQDIVEKFVRNEMDLQEFRRTFAQRWRFSQPDQRKYADWLIEDGKDILMGEEGDDHAKGKIILKLLKGGPTGS